MTNIDAQRQLSIHVDWFRPSGKWYAGGEVNIGLTRFHEDTFPAAILEFQKILTKGWENQEWYVVTRDLPEFDKDPQYGLFNIGLFTSKDFR